MLGKRGGLKLLEKAFSTDEYSEEDLKYMADVLRRTSGRTIWNTFDSANNYRMPSPVITNCRNIEYWFSDAEEKERRWDISYFRKNFQGVTFRKFRDVGHGGLAPLHPERFVDALMKAIHSAE